MDWNNFWTDLGDWIGFGRARREREYDYGMSSTAYQRAVTDMVKAGLNPALMYSSGANPSASASHYSGTSASSGSFLSGIGTIVNSATNFINSGHTNRYIDSKAAKSSVDILHSASKIAKILSAL